MVRTQRAALPHAAPTAGEEFWAVGAIAQRLRSFRLEVSKRWLRVLHCRSQKSRMTWKRLAGFEDLAVYSIVGACVRRLPSEQRIVQR